MYYSIELFIQIYMQRYKYYRIRTNNSIYINKKSIIFDVNQYYFIALLMSRCEYVNMIIWKNDTLSKVTILFDNS